MQTFDAFTSIRKEPQTKTKGHAMQTEDTEDMRRDVSKFGRPVADECALALHR